MRLRFAAALFALTTPALAHHPMDGKTPETLFQGLLSGFGHPIIGVDHLAFVIAVGLLALSYGRRLRPWLPLAFVAATVAGTGVHLLALNLPYPEIIIALLVLTLGVLVALRMTLPVALTAALFALAGVFHGYAYGEAVVGAEATPLIAYLAGFAIIQYAIAGVAMLLGERLLRSGTGVALRIAGAAIAAVGALFLALSTA